MKPCIGTLKTVMTNGLLFQGRTGIAVQKFGYAGASREGNLLHERVHAKLLADFLDISVCGDNVDDTSRDACPVGKLN